MYLVHVLYRKVNKTSTMSVRRTKQFILLGSDILLFFCALWLSLVVRSGSYVPYTVFERYIPLFMTICGIYVLLQYIVGAYDTTAGRTSKHRLSTTLTSAAFTFLLATLYFYLLRDPKISPKTILLLTISIASIFGYIVRYLLRLVYDKSSYSEYIGIIGRDTNPDIRALKEAIQDQTDISLEWLTAQPTTEDITSVQTIVLHKDLFTSEDIKKLLYTQAVGKQHIITFSELYESVCKKIPSGNLTDDWFITHVQTVSVTYEHVKNMVDYLFGMLLFVIFLIVLLPITVVIKLSSKGPILIKQTRIGKNGTHFTLYKFRTMYALAADGSAETDGAVFSTKGDSRITPIGHILRKTRLDELPQAINLLKRDISIIGPRPERPEIVDSLTSEAPYFSARTLVMPGITGWAAVHQHYTDTKASTIEKLQYDLYYIKHRSFWIDIKILLLTVRTIINLKGQ